MGCHTWFYKPATEEEYKIIRSKAYESACDFCGPLSDN